MKKRFNLGGGVEHEKGFLTMLGASPYLEKQGGIEFVLAGKTHIYHVLDTTVKMDVIGSVERRKEPYPRDYNDAFLTVYASGFFSGTKIKKAMEYLGDVTLEEICEVTPRGR